MTAQGNELIDKAAAEAFAQLANTGDRFERYDNAHASRIATISDEIAKIFHLARHDRGSLRVAALLHDLGEVAMERDYIQRAGSLTDEDLLDLARHPVIGEREASRVGADRAAQLLVRWHHEWWNGAGYPDGLHQENIPFSARLFALADVYDALTSNRPYRSAWSKQDAVQYIETQAGTHFDPRIVPEFLNMVNSSSL